MEPIRADEERVGGIIHKPMFERLLLCDFAIADLTTGNPNVYYELGVRHAARPMTTLAIFAEYQNPPFDLNLLRAMPYRLGEGNSFGPREAAELMSKLIRRLTDLRGLARSQGAVDSPLFQLLTDYRAPDIALLKTDVFREREDQSAKIKARLARARELGDADSVERIESSLGEFDAVELGVLVDLFSTWRALSEWDRMILVYEKLPQPLKRSVMMREQYGFALNRANRRNEALKVLEAVVQEQGPSSETLGLIGRIYKDQWIQARSQTQLRMALGYLDKAISAYIAGFEADSRDAYPGVNAVTLLDIKGDEESLRQKDELLPVVKFAVERRLKNARLIYWDYATLLELAVLKNNEAEAFQHLSDALASVREPWEAATTANNLRLILESRKERDAMQPWLVEITDELQKRSETAATV
jgi:tetratricopeptide (TPR) repeat protein